MSPTFAIRRGGTRYRYYVCANAQRRGWHRCPSKSISASSMEHFVVEQVRSLAADPAKLRAMIAGLSAEDIEGDQRDDEEAAFDLTTDVIRQPVWDELPSEQKATALRRLIEEVNYDGANGKVAITFRPDGLRALAKEEDPS
jgi:hypothetical protein